MNKAPIFDAGLVSRYDLPGPRYTSYPTAPQFTEAFGAREFRRFAATSNEQASARPISLYVHVPWCFSRCFYCGCNRLITRDPAKGERYVERLLMEIGMALQQRARSRFLDRARPAARRERRHRRVGAARLQPGEPRRAGFRSGGAARGEPGPERP